jgi:hypothetical protein
MATIDWISGKTGSFQTAANWKGGVAPTAADTAVIDTAGDAAPTTSGQLLVPASGGSRAILAGLTIDGATTHQTTVAGGVDETYFTSLAPSQVPAGETVAGGLVDLIAGGAESALYLQNSTLGAKTTLNVNGDAYVYGGYTNTLAGAIDIGLPFSVAGVAQAQPKADALGFTSALYLDIQAWGSWTGPDVPAAYVPGVKNTGVITIGGGSAMVVALSTQASAVEKTGPKTETSLPPMSSQFDNNGTIKVEAGGLFNSFDTFGSGLGAIVDNGAVDVLGAAGKATRAVFGTNVSGDGTIDLQGGTQTSATQTVAQFDAQVAGASFTINNAGLLLEPGQFVVNASGYSYRGGTVAFASAKGDLEIVAPVENTVAKLFGDTITGFRAGDEIVLKYFITDTLGVWSQQLVWTQSTNTLQLYNVLTESGIPTKSLEASFKLTGTYAASSFKVEDASWNGELLSAASLVIVTTQAAPSAAAAPTPALFAQRAATLAPTAAAGHAADHASFAPQAAHMLATPLA